MTNFKNSGMLLSEWIKMNQANQERLSNRSAASSLNSNGYPRGSNSRSIDNIQPNSSQKQFQNHQVNDYSASQDTSSVRSAQSMPSVYVRKMRLDGFDSNAHVKQDNQKINKTAIIAPVNLNYKSVAAQNHWYKMTKKQNGVKIEQISNERPLVLPVVVKQSSEDKGSSRSIDIISEDKNKNAHIEKPLVLPAVINQSSEDKKSSRGTEIITEDKSRNLLVETKSNSIDSATHQHLVKHDSIVFVSNTELKDKTMQNLNTTVENKATENSDEKIIILGTKTVNKSEQEKFEEIKKESIVESTLQKDSKEENVVIQEHVQNKSSNASDQTNIQSINQSENVHSLAENKQIKNEGLKSSKIKTESQNTMENTEKINVQLQAVNRENKDNPKVIEKQNRESESATKKHVKKSQDIRNEQSKKSEKQNSTEKTQKSNEGAPVKNETNETLQNTPKNPGQTDNVNELINKLDKVVEDNLNIIKSNEYEKFDKAEGKNELLEKILSTEFQASVDKFLNSNDYQNSFLNNVKNLSK